VTRWLATPLFEDRRTRDRIAPRLVFVAIAMTVFLPWWPASPASSKAPEAIRARDRSLARLEPASGAYFGVNLNWDVDTGAAFSQRVGKTAAVYVQFAAFPLGADERSYLHSFIEQVAEQRAIALLTLEPFDGLDTVTSDSANDLAEYLAAINARDVPVLLRFAHEMNGSWYPWGQRPEQYVRAFRLVAEAVHQRTSRTAMLWAPNYGSGYPYSGGQFVALPGSGEFDLLDTNGDRILDMRDDPYGPYYPGDAAVDWVGMSLYHWGYEYPWGDNVVPDPEKFLGQLTGNYSTPSSNERTLPDFYREYTEAHGKPMAIPETAAFYRPGRAGSHERDIKRSWIEQVFGSGVERELPNIKLVSWFEWNKFEPEVGAIVDWRMTADLELAGEARDLLSARYWLSAEDVVHTS